MQQNITITIPARAVAALGVAALTIACGLSLQRKGSAAPPTSAAKLIEAQEFRLVDASGATRATLATQPDGSPYVSLFDKADKRRITLRVLPDGGATCTINDPDGKNRVALDSSADGSASISATSRKSKAGAGLLVPADATPIVIVKDKDGGIAFAEPQPDQPDDPKAPKPGEPGKKPGNE